MNFVRKESIGACKDRMRDYCQPGKVMGFRAFDLLQKEPIPCNNFPL